MCLSAIAGIGSALIGASSAKSAARSQERAADQQAAVQREIYQDQTERFEPFYQGGQNALAAYMYEMGLGPRPTASGDAGPSEGQYSADDIETVTGGGDWIVSGSFRGRDWPQRIFQSEAEARRYARDGQRAMSGDGEGRATMPSVRQMGGGVTGYRVGDQTFNTRQEAENFVSGGSAGSGGDFEYRGFRATPGYQFRVNEGQRALESSAAARGGLYSGRTMEDLTEFGQNIASREYGNYMNRLGGLTDMGVGAAGNQATAGTNYASGMANAYANMGNAGAAGAIGTGNALMGGLNTGLGIWQYKNNTNPLSQGTFASQGGFDPFNPMASFR